MAAKKLVLFLFALLLCINIASAYQTGSVAYVVKNTYYADQIMVDTLEDMGFTVTLLKTSQLAGVNWDSYLFLMVNDEIFTNPGDVPVNQKKCLILNTWNLNDFHWAKQGSQYASSQPIILLNQKPGHIITQGLGQNVTVYTSAKYVGDGVNVPVNYLYRFDKATGLTSVVSTIINSLDAVIATAEKGAKLRDGVYANEKGAFFGISETAYWTPAAKTLFENTVIWLLTDTAPPVILGNVVVDTITETSARVAWTTDKVSSSVVNYGTTTALGKTASAAGQVTSHSVTLTGLSPLTKYYFTVTSCNADNYCTTSAQGDFTTKDLTPPAITLLDVTRLTDKEADITVSTNEPASAKLFYGTSSGSLTQTKEFTNFAASHVFLLTGLTDHTKYYYKVHVCDQYSNCADSAVKDFTTKDFTAPGAPLNLIASVINANRHIRLDWAAPTGEPVDHYNIYISGTPSGFNFNTPTATTQSVFWEDATAQDAQQRFYVVRAADAGGNEEKNTNIVGKFDINLASGSNLISLPLVPFDTSMAAVMHQDSSFYPVKEVIRNGASGYETATFSSGAWVQPFEMKNNEGYFLKTDNVYVFTMVGRPTSAPQTVQIKAGVNFVGWTSLNTRALSAAIAQGSPIGEVFNYVAPDIYNIATYYAEHNWWACTTMFDLTPGHGYVFKSSQATTWEYTP